MCLKDIAQIIPVTWMPLTLAISVLFFRCVCLSTQTPSSWAEETRGRRRSGGHKRSASWGSAEHLKEVSKSSGLLLLVQDSEVGG